MVQKHGRIKNPFHGIYVRMYLLSRVTPKHKLTLRHTGDSSMHVAANKEKGALLKVDVRMKWIDS